MRVGVTVDHSFVVAFRAALEHQRSVQDQPEAYEKACDETDAAARDLAMTVLDQLDAGVTVEVESPEEFCDECGAPVPEDAASVMGPWHKDTCSAYEPQLSARRTEQAAGGDQVATSQTLGQRTVAVLREVLADAKKLGPDYRRALGQSLRNLADALEADGG